jgi:hypothetical protein
MAIITSYQETLYLGLKEPTLFSKAAWLSIEVKYLGLTSIDRRGISSWII